MVVLDVAGAGLGDGGDGLHLVERLGALELGHDRLGRAAEVVDEHAEAAAVGHADHDLFGAGCARLRHERIDHRHDDVQALDREHLLAEVCLLDKALEPEHLEQALEKGALLIRFERRAMRAGLDHLAQPHALLVGGEMLDLVRDRAAVRLAHSRQRVEERLALDADAKDGRGDPRHELGRQVEALGLERGVALGLTLGQRIDPRGQVPVGAEGLEQRGRGLHGLEELAIRLG